jgi:hypothetical protein
VTLLAAIATLIAGIAIGIGATFAFAVVLHARGGDE